MNAAQEEVDAQEVTVEDTRKYTINYVCALWKLDAPDLQEIEDIVREAADLQEGSSPQPEMKVATDAARQATSRGTVQTTEAMAPTEAIAEDPTGLDLGTPETGTEEMTGDNNAQEALDPEALPGVQEAETTEERDHHKAETGADQATQSDDHRCQHTCSMLQAVTG